MNYSRIIGTGSYLPARVLSNSDLEQIVETTDEWIITRTGIRERRIMAEKELLSDMVEIAAKKAIESAGISGNSIDLIIVATLSSEYVFPSASCVLQKRLNLRNCPAFDLNAGCTGFIYGLNIADQYIKSGTAKNVLVVGAEALSKFVNWQDRSTCVLFGDGAGAAVLGADNAPGIRSTHIHADGNYGDLLFADNLLYRVNVNGYITMRGNELFKLAVNKLSEVVQETLDYNKIDDSAIDWLVPHQANLRIIQAMAKKLNLPMERVILTLEKHGNTSAASIPLALDDGIRSGKIKKGDTLLMEAFGAGLTWGAALIDY